MDHPGPSEQGFDYWMGTTLNSFKGPKNSKKFILNGEPLGEVDGWYCDVIVDKACDWLKNIRNKEKPFFMYVCSHEPHTPIAPPEEYIGKEIELFVLGYDKENIGFSSEAWISAYPFPWEKIDLVLERNDYKKMKL